ncbi:hybrid sensor histidine kinase/response regulator [Methylocystis heyeri]|uniref:Response regulator n=1 Tax=Methylocystis heyeri TaxID=391905 RepID=A0A6B8KA53_9HYPH|nr:response regulator [Methylocystis heyeri]QGM44312.1 response regulator [Methylocystis heyeri]
MDSWTFVLEDKARILIVDDDPILVEFAKVHLATPQTTVESAADGLEGWNRLTTEDFDLALLDIEMPGLDGFGLLEKLRADPRFAQLPVVMLTGREDVASIDRAFRLGANSFITKPINWRKLSYSLKYVLRTTNMEAELLRERRRVEELSQLTSNMLSLIRMEMRAPISTIIGFANCIAQQIDGPISLKSYISYAQQIGASANHLQSSLLDLIQYAQLSSSDAKLAFDEYLASSVMDAALAGFYMSDTQSKTPVVVNKPAEDFYLLCDRHWLARALTHLIENACLRAGDSETVVFTLKRDTTGDVLFSIRSRSAREVDTAASASPQNVRLVHGLGAPFAGRIAELHDGSLKETQCAEDFETVEIRLPAARALESVTRLPPQPKLAANFS